jgi:hypothetical protein
VKSSLADSARFINEAMMANIVASRPGGAVRAIRISIGTMVSWASGAVIVVSIKAMVRALTPSRSCRP